MRSPLVDRCAPLARSASIVAALSLTCVLPSAAQQPKPFTNADYQRAERTAQAPAVVTTMANAGRVTANWLPDERFWYRDSSSDGVQFMLVDPVKKTRLPAFDHAKVAAALATATGAPVDGTHLPFTTITFTKDAKSVMVAVTGKEWSCPVAGGKCTALAEGAIASAAAGEPAPGARGAGGRGGRGAAGGRGGVAAGRGGAGGGRGGAGGASPDGKYTVAIRDFNLVAHDMATNQDIKLTTDGVKDFGYATDNAGWASTPNAILAWSPDSKKIATQQQDERGVGKMDIVSTPNGGANGRMGGHPVLKEWNYPLPGDSIITTIQRVIIDVPSHTVVRLKMPPDQHRSIQGDNLSMSDVKWAPDASRIVFASVSRDHKTVWVREADANTGVVRTIFQETSPTHVENWAGGWQVLWKSNEILWYSQKDNYGHLYLYDLTTGLPKNLITSGTGNVTGVTRLNDTTRTLWYTALGGEGGNPYFPHHYRVNLDGTHQVSLDPDDGNHDNPAYSPSGKYFIDSWSKTAVPTASALRDATTGALILPLSKPADTAAMHRAGWNPVTTIRMKARDGTTDIYGQMYRPSNFDPTKKYPIINHIYPGPQTGSVGGGWGWKAGGGETQGLAELGFIVVEINGMGTPGRDKKFMDAYYLHMGDNTLPDQVAGMKELGARYPWIDLNRVGIYGHSGGGFATAGAMFHFPDFFKVGISESGNHDNREYEDDWGERYEGIVVRNPDGTDQYDAEANQTFAKNLKGHLMLAHGTLDNNVPPYNTLLVVDALIKAGKKFDLVLIPNVPHAYGSPGTAYMQCRRWDYFSTWLLGNAPMDDCSVAVPAGGGRGGRGGGPPGN